MTTITIPVNGMHCGACQNRVQAALTRTDGVKQATVDLGRKSATVTFDESAVLPQKLVQVINATGYQAELPNGGQNNGTFSEED